MHVSRSDLPPMVMGDYEGRTIDANGMRIAFESMPAQFPPDESPFKGLPDDRCQCDHCGGVVIGVTAPYAQKAIEELPVLWDGFAVLVRAGLGISAFGANIIVLPPCYTTEPHDESDTGQQELYVALAGSGAVDIAGMRLALDPDHFVRVDAGTARTLTSGPDGLRVLCVGGVPGAAYQPPEWSSGP
jgi:mannose-6-phosphate isomerase-like protein (cupin superfamily)